MTDVSQRLWVVVEPYVAAEGIELDDIEILGAGKSRLVRITLDAPETLRVDRIANLSKGISRLLDESEPFPGSYTLEVSSPGLERNLRRPRHYEKSVGRELKVKTAVPVDGARSHRGSLSKADENGFELLVDGTSRRIDYSDVASARTVFIWTRGGKPGHAAGDRS